MIEGFDVLIESFRPGVMDRLGVGYEVLSAANPALIYCAITGYGQDGPRSQVAGHDVNYIGYAGVLSITGPDGGPPVIPGVQIGDLAGGGMSAVIAILSALHQRTRTGRGEMCDISMMDGAVSWLSIHAAEFAATKDTPTFERMHLSGRYPCYRIYPAADGYLTVGALEPQFWRALCDAIERPDLADDAFAMGERRDEVIADLESLFSTRTRSAWMDLFDGRDVCVGPVNDLAETFEDPQVKARGMVVSAELPNVGELSILGDPIRIGTGQGAVMKRPPPGLGEHTDEVLGELGFTSEEVDRLRSRGVL